MKVIIVDDTVSFADSLKDLIISEGYETEVYHTVKAAREHLTGIEKPLVAIVDHDFSDIGEREEVGYDLCRWLRENHPFGLLLPIIYLTGREPPERYLRQQRQDPFVHPNAYISKEQLATEQALLPNLLQQYAQQFDRIRELFEKQSAQQALIGFSEMDPEQDKYELT